MYISSFLGIEQQSYRDDTAAIVLAKGRALEQKSIRVCGWWQVKLILVCGDYRVSGTPTVCVVVRKSSMPKYVISSVGNPFYQRYIILIAYRLADGGCGNSSKVLK